MRARAHARTHAHTHTRLMTLCPGLPRWAGARKVKSIWILLKQETASGSGVSWAICKSANRSRQITMPAPPPLSFLQARCTSCRPTNSLKALKAYTLYRQCAKKRSTLKHYSISKFWSRNIIKTDHKAVFVMKFQKYPVVASPSSAETKIYVGAQLQTNYSVMSVNYHPLQSGKINISAHLQPTKYTARQLKM